MHPRFRLACSLLLVLGGISVSRAGEVPDPSTHLGFRPGADFRLATWPSVVDYFRKVDDASDRVVVRELGKTTEGRPYVVAIVSDEATIKDLDRHQKVQKALAQPHHPAVDGSKGAPESKPVVLITCSIHSTETASTLMAMELLHDLASKDDPATRDILANSILLLVPSANPDGVDKVAAWYERTKGHPWEGDGMPELYHKYAGHDTNRDWFMLNLQETKLLTRFLYQEWPPTLAYDVHQMGSRGARIFVPPFFDPINPNLDARLNQGIFLVGAHMAADLASAGKQGVLSNAMYDNWWNGGMRTTPQRHNVVAVLTEAASVKMASPIFVDKAQLAGQTRGFTNHEPAVNFVEPWPGGWWRLRDIVDYQLICARSILSLAGRYRGQFQSNYLRLGLEAVQKGRAEPPYGWVVPIDQRDPGTASKLVGILHESGIRVLKAKAPFAADGVTYPAGSWLLPADQPYRAHLKDMMERQHYPNRFGPNGQAEPPYDVAGWTLPLQMGVRSVALGSPYSGQFEELERIEPPKGSIEGDDKPDFYAIRNRANDDIRVLNALFEANIEVVSLTKPAGEKPQAGEFNSVNQGTRKVDRELPIDTVLIKATPESRAALDRILATVSTRVEGRTGLSTNPRFVAGSTYGISELAPSTVPLRKPKVALYQPWVPSMDEGWTRLILEQFDFPYATVHDAEIRAGRLLERFRTILFPSISARTLREGYRPAETEPAYVGGLGPEGINALKDFVEEGGTLVCLEDSCAFAIESLGLPVKEVLKDQKTSDFYAPGSILRCNLQDGWLTIGMPDEVSVYFDRSMAFELTGSKDSKIQATYAKGNPLESGWLLGPEKIQGKAALVDVSLGKGHVVLFGFPPQHRGQTHGTFRLLFNALR
jgi:Zinc carboxypeptidase